MAVSVPFEILCVIAKFFAERLEDAYYRVKERIKG
jgi:hypothetical protein